MKKKHLILLIIIWSSLMMISFFWGFAVTVSNNKKVVINKAKAFFDQIVATRAWNSYHGGVYVPVTEFTQPNPYLKDSLRDVITTDSMQLTMINPAYMTRQISEINKANYEIQFHMTSLKPIRPANKPDEWETEALLAFENNTKEIIELIKTDSSNQYRYIAPLITENSCLKCHAHQGYKIGDIRGGLSVSFPADIYLKAIKKRAFSNALIHFFTILFGIIGLLAFYYLTKKHYLVIKKKNKELVQTVAAKDKLFSIIAHDLKSPFNVILGFSNILKRKYDELSDKDRKKFINDIDKSSNSTYELLERLLLWAMTQQGKITIKPVNLNLKKLVSESVDVGIPAVQLKSITYKIQIPDDLFVFADKNTIKTVITNLFTNAVKYTEKGGNITVEAEKKEHAVNISIIDNGIGIPQDIIPKLFLIEESISTLGTDKEKGTGLGLLICKEFIKKNQGKIWVESELGKGTKITFTLPVKPM